MIGERIYQQCVAFEDAWIEEQESPKIESYLSELTDPEKSDLLQELLYIDLSYRVQQKTNPTYDEYCQRFPEYSDLVSRVFRDSPDTHNEEDVRTALSLSPATEEEDVASNIGVFNRE